MIKTFKKISKKGSLYIITIESLILFTLISALIIQTLYRLPIQNQTKKNISEIPIAKSYSIKNSTSSAFVVKYAQSSPSVTVPTSFGASVRVPILMYHYIGNNPNPADTERYVLSTAPDLFDAQLGYLAKNGYHPITLDTLYAALKGGILPAKPIVLSIDDGYEDLFYNAYPIILKYHFHVTSFIPTGLINQGYYLHWDQIKQMQSSGLFSFEAHSISHPNLPSLSYSAQKNEIFTSKSVLETETGSKVNFFAYPYGTSDTITRQLVQQAGFLGAVGTWYGITESLGDEYDWPRVRIVGGTSVSEFAAKL